MLSCSSMHSHSASWYTAYFLKLQNIISFKTFAATWFPILRQNCNLQFCLRMGTELVLETLYSNELTRLCAREDYIEFTKYYFHYKIFTYNLNVSYAICSARGLESKRIEHIFLRRLIRKCLTLISAHAVLRTVKFSKVVLMYDC